MITEAEQTPGRLRIGQLSFAGQFEVTSNYLSIDGNFKDRFIHFSGYFGAYGPHMFAAAPEMLEALKDCRDLIENMPVEELLMQVEAAIAKAEGRAEG
jgi:hypothetical protein